MTRFAASLNARFISLLAASQEITDDDTLQSLRAVRVLEQASTVDARQVLAKLAEGAPSARLTVIAKAAIQRLATSD
jgi:hypothetical protein